MPNDVIPCFNKTRETAKQDLIFLLNMLGLSVLSEDTEMEVSLKVNVGFLFHNENEYNNLLHC